LDPLVYDTLVVRGMLCKHRLLVRIFLFHSLVSCYFPCECDAQLLTNRDALLLLHHLFVLEHLQPSLLGSLLPLNRLQIFVAETTLQKLSLAKGVATCDVEVLFYDGSAYCAFFFKL
jgi:hypothetical protein